MFLCELAEDLIEPLCNRIPAALRFCGVLVGVQGAFLQKRWVAVEPFESRGDSFRVDELAARQRSRGGQAQAWWEQLSGAVPDLTCAAVTWDDLLGSRCCVLECGQAPAFGFGRRSVAVFGRDRRARRVASAS